ncbi:MAG: hypothetical protein ACRDVG_02870 [Jatrophihabitantaceae bacterium]
MPRTLHWAQLALATGAASSIAEAGLLVFTRAGGSGDFKYTADYWLTGVGIPAALASVVLLVCVRSLQGGRTGRLGLAGLLINNLACLLLAAQLATGVAMATEVHWGPSYPLATLAAFVGLSLFAAGSWRIGLLPRWMLGTWPVIWVIGSMAAIGATPLLLAGFYTAMAVIIARRLATAALTNPRPRRRKLSPPGGGTSHTRSGHTTPSPHISLRIAHV